MGCVAAMFMPLFAKIITGRANSMLTHEKIHAAIVQTATTHPIKKAAYFGSYAAFHRHVVQ